MTAEAVSTPGGPTARRAPSRGATVVVAGTAGGVGTTTVAALLVRALAERGAPVGASNHTLGGLGSRIVPGDLGDRPAPLDVHDLGPHALTATELLLSETTVPVIVTRASSAGARAALRALERLAPDAALVVASTSPRRRPDACLDAVLSQRPGTSAIALPYDDALALPGSLRPEGFAPSTRDAVRRLGDLLGD
ncbi:hypothetical protein [Sinomonas sp. P47F7]|uniref:hypothetical protein n=1 Tax=Sinomonas sp. P47F7 TaxID=3410987 RepID=UPI003BF491E9